MTAKMLTLLGSESTDVVLPQSMAQIAIRDTPQQPVAACHVVLLP